MQSRLNVAVDSMMTFADSGLVTVGDDDDDDGGDEDIAAVLKAEGSARSAHADADGVD